jgi:hypothetical protein
VKGIFPVKEKPWLARLSIAPATACVRSNLFNLILLALVLGLGAAVAVTAYGYGQHLMEEEDDSSREQIAMLNQKVEQLARAATVAESARNIERATQQQLEAHIKTLEIENSRLKEDLLFFERLLPANRGAGEVAIRRLTAEYAPPNQLRYRLLVWASDNKDRQGFSGQAQLIVTASHGGRKTTFLFPQPNSPEEENFQIRFRHYQRLEGILTLPEGATVKSVQARILENGQIKAQYSIRL